MLELPRLLVLIGSGEMAPQMSRVHRSIIQRLAGASKDAAVVHAALIDTPYGFQENADALSASALDYFGRRLGMSAAIASLPQRTHDALAREAALATIREAAFVFSGPGSPSYALARWTGTEVPTLLAEKLTTGGAVVAASAAALTLGRLTVPVYEVYKAGTDPYWLPGLDVLASIGIAAAVVPHWDNAEGAGHDTRFSFLGERRLRVLEEQLPADTFILGIDEHTALVIDLDEGRAHVRGRGSVTIRKHGTDETLPAGHEISLDRLTNTAVDPAGGSSATAETAIASVDETRLARRVLALEDAAVDLHRRADLAESLIRELVAMRTNARNAGDYATADRLRDRLSALGIELTDSTDGTAYRLRG